MKRFGMFLMVLAVVGLSVATSNAALISTLALDNASTNGVSGAPDATLVGGPSYVTGNPVGAAGIAFSGSNYADCTTVGLPVGGEAYGSNDGGMWAGSASVWIKSTDSSYPTLARGRGTGDSSWLLGLGYDMASGSDYDTAHFMMRSEEGNTLTGAGTAPSWYDNNWHQVVYTWDIAASSMTFFMDGASKTVINFANSITTDDTFASSWALSSLGSGVDGDGYANEFYTGSVDDYGIWNEVLTAGKAGALYNVATASLDYNAADAAKLFDIAASGVSAVVGGKTWNKVTGLTGAAGSVTQSGSDWTVQLDGGIGVTTVPEPATLVLLAVAGLLVFAWKKR